VRQRLEELREYGIVGDIRGCGLLAGVEFVEDPDTRAPFDPSVKFGVRAGQAALEKGLLTRFDPNWIALAPPLVITREETDLMLDILADSIRVTVKELKTS
ncbi:MAG: aminotransferase class III-fold pyridoxal phosphate-dependent enzyme, partial [Gemmatimonadetes bacterium]|nr:aminotransferase class III-fold pyridoxal phosphate-dependent enzyme [Gemmatimonadota bacterium]